MKGFTLVLECREHPGVCSRVYRTVEEEIVDYIERLQVLREIVKKFPSVNYQVFKYIITHLNR
ncbi:hypothetical protein PAMP_006166 [Pampus punctatissimus]